MKTTIFLYSSLIFLMILNSVVVSGQGYSRTFWTAPVPFNGFASNEIITAAEFQNGQYLSLGLGNLSQFATAPVIANANESIGVSFRSATSPEPGSTLASHDPITILNGHDPIDSSYFFLTQRSFPTDGNYYINFSKFRYSGDPSSFFNLNVELNAIIESSDIPLIGKDMVRTADGGFFILAEIQSEIVPGEENIYNVYAVKVDAFGNVFFTQDYQIPGDDRPIKIMDLDNDNYGIVYQKDHVLGSDLYLLTIDGIGNIVSDVLIPNSGGLRAEDVFRTSDNALAVTGANAMDDLFVLKIGLDAQPIWLQEYTTPLDDRQGRGITEDTNGNLIIAGLIVDDMVGTPDGMIAKLTASGAPIWERNMGRVDRPSAFNNVVITPSGYYSFSGYLELEPPSVGRGAWVVQTDTMGIVKGGLISGNVFYDEFQDCINVNELNLENWIVTAASSTDTVYGQTDENGNYSIEIDLTAGDTVDYLVSVAPPNLYWDICENNVPVTLTYLVPDTVNFAAQSIVNCSFINATLSTPFVRPCENNNFVIDYCNNGTVPIEDASFRLTLDDHLSFVSAGIPPTIIDGQTLTWEVDFIPVNSCGQIPIVTFADCDSVEINDILCLDLMITPDTICLGAIQSTAWSGALLELDHTCDTDNLIFNITNTGTGSMIDALDYIIIEDAVLREQNSFELLPGESHESPQLPLNGATYHILAPQEPGAPGVPLLSISTMDCTSGPGDPNNQILQNNGDPFNITVCPVVVGSFDPNDKTAYPTGLTEEHLIPPNTELEYTIRFQNTGTDTAFRVVLLDTLSNLLDPSTFVSGPSSHPYTWDLSERGILSFNFNNIELPDSLTNPAGSQGYVTFTIDQQRDLPEGTIIENRAGIYFDFNAPIITNTTFHKIFDFLNIVTGTIETVTPEIQVTLSPNPMMEGTWLTLEGIALSTEPIVVTLYDVTGKVIYSVSGNDNRVWLPRKNLTAGMYFFTVSNAKGWLASGKLMAH